MDAFAYLPEIAIGEHVIGAFAERHDGPTLIVVGSLHGNEPAGAIALERVMARLVTMAHKLKGRVYLLSGNTRALDSGVRFIGCDLNRFWTRQNMSAAGAAVVRDIPEGAELTELNNIFDSIMVTAMDEVYVLDLHSTSAQGQPFATIGDTLRNREFAQKFPVTILLGIEEQLEGTMLEYLNNAGAVTLGFEGGSHWSPLTVDTHEAIVWLAMVNAGVLDASAIDGLAGYRELLEGGKSGAEIYEVRYRHAISSDDEFVMDPGFNNFDPVTAGQRLAKDRSGVVKAAESGVILMPLYQRLGEDGFFIGRRVAAFWLWLSALLRRAGVQRWINLLPGVRRDVNDTETLIVNTRVARLFPLQVFHLLGYRRLRWSESQLIVSRRKHDTDSSFKWAARV